MGEREVAYTVEDKVALDRVVEDLAERFESRSDRALRQRVYYDTFDWRIWRRKGRVWAEPFGAGWQLKWHTEGQRRPLRLPLEGELDRESVGFARDLPAGRFRDRLASQIEMRRLLPMVDVRAEGRRLRVLDPRRKTVARVLAEVPGARRPFSRGRRRQLEPILIVSPVKGYEAAFRRVTGFLEKELGLQEWDADELVAAAPLGGYGRAGAYTSKPATPLDPTTDADQAARAVLLDLLDTLEQNRAGTIEDLDSEFLHDLRVALRRTRSMLSLTRPIWPEAALATFRRELKWLGGVTGPARDLDVYLLELPRLAATVPKRARSDLDPLRALLEQKREREHASLVAALGGSRYRRLVRSWRRFLTRPTPEKERPDAARRPILVVASHVIGKAHRRVIKRGSAIDDATPAEALHRLRLDCKKLRYAMELFRTLYPPREIERLIRALKALQENLGAFNDFGVQQAMLGGLAAELGDSEHGSAAVMALGRLLDKLERGEALERRRFAERFAKFSSRKTSARFARLVARRETS